MSFFSRLRVLWVGFWSNFLGSAEDRNPEAFNRGLIQDHQRQLNRLREALAELIFQRKKIEQRLNELMTEESQLKGDLQVAAAQDRDDLALELIARLEKISEEGGVLAEQKIKIDTDIQSARDTEVELARETQVLKHRLESLSSRHQFLQMRKQLKSNVEHASQLSSNATNGLGRIQERIHRLEADMEAMGETPNKYDKELSDMREDQKRQRHMDVLMRIKNGMKNQSASRLLVPVS
ncbi:MAG: PspA/IM30 family protein [Bdellovibrionaceae bacterium]|nr:PspA/IM30 family protein [Bdellovibrionales bacterium]MCB9086269.1 PspA/IM30 family protein [Pseudobdellovibrionaceae bacterium]